MLLRQREDHTGFEDTKTLDDGVTLETADPGTKERRLRSGWDDPDAPSRGWRVDTEVDETKPYYDDTSSANTGSGDAPAELWDAPSHYNTDRKLGKEFYTCAICSRNGESGKVIGCLEWGFLIKSTGDIKFKPIVPMPIHKEVPQVFKDAVRRWEEIPGYSPANVVFD